jgi:hypothetical protein
LVRNSGITGWNDRARGTLLRRFRSSAGYFDAPPRFWLSSEPRHCPTRSHGLTVSKHDGA